MPETSLTPRIPRSHLPPAFVIRRWPALAALEDNPFFLRRYYSKRPRRGWRLQHGYLIALGACVIGMIVNPRLGPMLPLGGIFFLAMLVILTRLLGSTKPALQLQFFLRQTPPPQLQELWLTALSPGDALFGHLAPWMSRRRVRVIGFVAGVSIAAFCVTLALFKLHAGFILLDGLLLGGMVAAAIRHIDAFHLSAIHRHVKSLHGMHVIIPGEKWGKRFDYVMGSLVRAAGTIIGLFLLIFALVRVCVVELVPMWNHLYKIGLLAESIILFVILLIVITFSIVLWIVAANRVRYVQELTLYMGRLWEQRALSEPERR